MEPKIFADKIFYYEDAIPNASFIVDSLESTDSIITDQDAITKWTEWAASADDGDTYQGDDRYIFGYQKHTNPENLSTSSKEIREIYDTISNSLFNCAEHYCNTLGLEYVEPSPIRISKYQKGAEMGPHIDWDGHPLAGPIMSAVLYLNSNYEGGELDFPELDVRIKPKAGSIVIFPSVAPYYHQSLIIESGFKYMSPAFWIKHL